MGRRLAGRVALGAALCLGICLLVAVPANRLADSHIVRHVIVADAAVDEPHWAPSSFPDFGVTFSVPSSWFVYQRTEIYSMASQLGFVSTVSMLMGQRVRLPASGGVFVTWTSVSSLGAGISRVDGMVTTVAGHPARVQHVTARTGCRRLDGDREVLASVALTQNPKDPTFLFVDSCVAGNDRSLDRDVEGLLSDIAFDPR